jgi:hypothetical protein
MCRFARLAVLVRGTRRARARDSPCSFAELAVLVRATRRAVVWPRGVQLDGVMTVDGATIDAVPAEALAEWFRAEVPGVAGGPLVVERISGGHSNLTYRVTDTAGSAWALRRPRGWCSPPRTTWGGSGGS